jgi:hypothetical protein
VKSVEMSECARVCGVQALESLQGDVAKVLTEKEQQEALHVQRKNKILAAKQAEDKRHARELERVCRGEVGVVWGREKVVHEPVLGVVA